MENLFILAGGFLIFIGTLLLAVGILFSGGGRSDVRGGAVIFIGPIPIAFGTERESLVTVSILMVVMILLFYFFFREFRP